MKVVFLDRDNTLNVDPGYLNDPHQVELLPGVHEGLMLLTEIGYTMIVLTNQSGIARGLIDPKNLLLINERISELILPSKIQEYFVCPHVDEDDCDCRKPKSGLVKQALSKYPVDVESSFIIGDRYRDIWAGEPHRIPGILVGDGDQGEPPTNLKHHAKSFSDAAQWVKSQLRA